MLTLSDEFAEILREARDHTLATHAEVVDASGVKVADLPGVLSGSVSQERRRAVRRTCQVQIVDESGDLTPTEATDLLAPYGNAVRLYRGAVIGGAEELVPLGTMRVAAPDVRVDDRGTVVSLSGFDRARTVQRARWTDAYVIASGTNVADAIRDGLLDRDPLAQFGTWVATTRTTPKVTFGMDQRNDPWADLEGLAEADGLVLSVDPYGAYQLTQEPDPAAADPVWTFGPDVGATLTEVGRSWDDETGYNGVKASGESTDPNVAPVSATVWDDDPASPTYYQGPYGQVPRFYVSSLITTQDQAESAAESILRRYLGVVEAVTFGTIVNPALEVDDVIAIERAGVVDATYAIETLTTPLSADGVQSGATRTRVVS